VNIMPLVNPHGGGDLLPLLLQGEELAAEKRRAATLPRVRVTSREKGDIIMLGIGGFTPLEGFMTRADWAGVCDGMKMANGLFWPIPITLSTDKETAASFKTGADIALVDRDGGELLATMRVTEKYEINKAHECATVFRTADPEHPGVKMVMEQGEVNLAGPLKVLSDGGFKAAYGELFMTPAETRAAFEKLGWSKVAAFQTRNPMHRSHEYLAKVAIDTCDGVLVHSLLGALKPGDIPAHIRTRAIAVLAEKYFVKKTVVQAGYPLDMRYAGPREALLHALFRQNYGCSRPCWGRQLLRTVRRAPRLRPHSEGRARDAAAQDRLDLLVLQVRRHGLRPHLSAWRRRPPAGFGYQAAQVALRRQPGAARVQPARGAGDPA
jgi:sulfate adenylyltransferase